MSQCSEDSSNLARELEKVRRCSIPEVLFCERLGTEQFKHYNCPEFLEVFFEKGWLTCASSVCNNTKIEWTYELTIKFLSCMKTKKKLSLEHYLELCVSLKDPMDDDESGYESVYDLFMVRLLNVMKSIQIQKSSNNPSRDYPSSYDINMTDENGRTPLFLECRCEENAHLVHKKIWTWTGLGADVNTVDQKGNTLLHALANCNHRCGKSMDELLELSPNMLNSKNVDGNTPLHVAVMKGHDSVVKTIIRNFLDNSGYDSQEDVLPLKNYMNLKNKFDRTALDMIKQPRFLEREYGEYVETQDGTMYWKDERDFIRYVECVGMLMSSGATVSKETALWLENLSNMQPMCSLVKLVATRALVGQIKDEGGSTDTRDIIRRFLNSRRETLNVRRALYYD